MGDYGKVLYDLRNNLHRDIVQTASLNDIFFDDENKPVTPEESLVKKDVDAGVESESEQKLHSGTDLPTTFCTVKLSVEYTPSKKDQQEKLYELCDSIIEYENKSKKRNR